MSWTEAFLIDEDVLMNGVPSISFAADDLTRLASCDAAFMFDRVYPVPSQVVSILVLGGLAYDHARDAARSQRWSELIVPSEYVRTGVLDLLGDSAARVRDHVHVIPNPVAAPGEAYSGCSSGNGSELKLLFPHRADRGKGIEPALELLRELSLDYDATLTITADVSPTAEAGFYDLVIRHAANLGVVERVRFARWCDRGEVWDLYRSADLTVCLGELEEGFGLVPVESVAVGTPVISSGAGAYGEVLPEGHGSIVLGGSAAEMAKSVREVLAGGRSRDDLERGRKYIARTFSVETFVKRCLEVAGA